MSDELTPQNKGISPNLQEKIRMANGDASRHAGTPQNHDRDNSDQPRQSPKPPRRQPSQPQDKSRKILIAIIAVLGTVILAGLVWLIFGSTPSEPSDEEKALIEDAREIDLQQQLADSEFENLEHDFAQFETQRTLVKNDTAKMRPTEQYNKAKIEIEKLQKELKNNKAKSAAEIQKLRDEIKTLRDLLKHYIAEIDRLNKENEALRSENAEYKSQNERLSSQVASTTRQNEVLNERMTLAEKLNVTGVSLTALNGKGKNEKKVEKAKQLMVTFTIPQNNSTPVGEKTIYLRITSPSGDLLRGGGTFSFEGSSLEATAKKSIEYSGEEVPGITMYWTPNVALTPGEYTVELFADNYRLKQSKFTLK